ncbi:hypothetical protein [Antarctobacter heliothermus]|uniref:Uncharacterized protein n=1 Tax=Antarctobacter heliothermus TaxID=74033 RepID=A0A239L4E1_9RHOB|nr:hypothetical protein [Antarctobacter heliothermus]SNT25456.1 hypothetical protein SAMN04488078_10793 [Antarctobacter heliothermus]
MRVLSLVLAFVAFGVGVLFFYARYERYQQNQRIEAQNDRKADANKLIKAINGIDGTSQECAGWMIGLTTGNYPQPETTENVALFFSETCGRSMSKRAEELTALVSGLADEDPEPGRAKLLAETRALAEVYRSQSDDFDQAYEMLSQADNRAALEPQVTRLVNRANPAINRGLSALEDARKNFIFTDG